MQPATRHKLRDFIQTYGVAIIDDPARCRNILRDLFAGEYRPELNAFQRALEEHVPQHLLSRSLPLQMHLAQLARRLQDDHGQTIETAQWAVNSWAYALGLIDLPGLDALERQPQPQPQRPPADVARPATTLVVPEPPPVQPPPGPIIPPPPPPKPSGAPWGIIGGAVLATLVGGALLLGRVTPAPLATPPTAAAPTDTPAPTVPPARLTAEALRAGGWKIFGPAQGELVHVDDNDIETFSSNTSVEDFVAEARFTNPYATSDGPWDYGFIFRSAGPGKQYMLTIGSTGRWSLLPDSQANLGGNVPGMRLGVGEQNTVRLVASGAEGYLFVNDTFVATLDLSARQAVGNVMVATGVYKGHIISGKITNYADFSVAAVGAEAVMLARTATVVAATQTAVADTLATAEALDASLSPTVAALTSSGTLAMFGPADKALTHNVDNKLIETLWADGTTGDFIAEARFTNPFDPNVGRWDYGFIFRDDTTQFYQLAVFADASWVLNLRSTSGEKLDIVNSGQLSNLQTGEGATNTLKLVASGAEGYLIVNDKVVGALNLAAHQVSGVVKAVTGIYSGDEVDGHTTQVTAFTVRRFDRPREWPVQLSDDFSSNANAWGEGTSEDNFAVVNRSFTDGTYHVDIQAKSSVFYRTQIQRDLGNRFLIGIDVQLLSGAADQTNYDLVFRYNADGSGGVSYYAFGVSDALTYRVDRYSDGAWTNLQSQTTSSAIKPGAINRLEVAGQDGVYSFFINGEQVTTISDTQLTGGKVGLGVSVFKSGSNGVFSFDNFELREP